MFGPFRNAYDDKVGSILLIISFVAPAPTFESVRRTSVLPYNIVSIRSVYRIWLKKRFDKITNNRLNGMLLTATPNEF